MAVENLMQRMITFVSQLQREEFQAIPKKTFSALMMLLVAYSVVRGVAGAASRPFWFDELLTLSIASQPTMRDMWVAITRGFDGQPPPFCLLERTCLGLPVSKEIALRLPSILSFPVLLNHLRFRGVFARCTALSGSITA